MQALKGFMNIFRYIESSPHSDATDKHKETISTIATSTLEEAQKLKESPKEEGDVGEDKGTISRIVDSSIDYILSYFPDD